MQADALVVDDRRADWFQRGSCLGAPNPELWFPEKGQTSGPAKAICRACPVREECLEYALAHAIRHGIWGGFSDRERKRIARGRPPRLQGT